MGEKINFVDTTMRDGIQSNWAMYFTYGMHDAVIREINQAHYSVVDAHANPMVMKVAVRLFKEDPWELFRLFKREITNSVIACEGMLTYLDPFSPIQPPMAMMKRWYELLTEVAGVGRHHLISNTRDELTVSFPKVVPIMKELGTQVVPAISYTVSPRHTDEYYGNLTRKIVEFKPDIIYIKDQGGLLTPDRVRTLVPVIVENAKGIPVELHSHCTTTFAPACYVEAMKLGIRTFHTAVPPVAYGSSQPSIFNVIANARLLGLEPNVNVEPLKVVEERMTAIAKQENLPIGAPLEYDYGQYLHMVPGGVISNLVAQLKGLGIAHKLDEVLAEVEQIIKDLGYPIMITPHSQFIVSQAAVNVAVGERYKEVLDCMIEFAVGVYGIEDAGVPYMDQNVKDRFLGDSRAKDIARKFELNTEEANSDESMESIRKRYGMTRASDEDLILHYVMGGSDEINLMRAAGPPRTFYTGKEPLMILLKELSKMKDIRRLHMQKGNSVFDFRQA